MTDPVTHTVYISVGSNLGNRSENCQTALRHVEALPSTTIVTTSGWIDNPALSHGEELPDFINGVIQIETSFTPEELFKNLQGIEEKMGRPKDRARWSSRVIDLDILLYSNIVVDTPNLKIPHPEMNKRIFVLKPLCDIGPDVIHPVAKVTTQELLKRLE